MQSIEDAVDEYYYSPGVSRIGDEYATAVLRTYSPYSWWGSHFFATLSTFDEVKRRNKSSKCGIIADKPGVGKTITSLALCQTRPFTEPDFLGSVSTSGLFKSKATVFFVPNNICSQWMQEIKKTVALNLKRPE
ncbi:hypothetical protein HDU98_004439, partial [Podochytrium sp. JEL0797]